MTLKKKVLIITYYWPPAGGPGVQRWLKFVKYLPDLGIEPVVYTPLNPMYPVVDYGLEKEISPELKVIKRKIREPYRWAQWFSGSKSKKISSGIIPPLKKQTWMERILLWVRGNFFIPDARIAWVVPSVRFLSDYLDNEGIDTIITTGPPHSVHLIGMALKEQKNIFWIADFRDPWTTIGYHKSLKLTQRSQKQHKELEQKVLNSADHILVTSPTTRKEFEQLTTKPISIITNGYDVMPGVEFEKDKKFTLAHIGSFLSERNPRVLWKAIKELIKENKDFKKDFRLKLAGKVSQEIVDTINEFRLEDYVDLMGYLSHEEAQKEQKKSQVLLLVEIDSEDTRCILPGKIFEYMVSDSPILAIGPDGSDIAGVLKETNTGSFFTYSEKEAIKNQLMDYYRKFKQNHLQVHPVGLQQYSRKKLTEKLVSVLHELHR